jgi:hypothetical protein
MSGFLIDALERRKRYKTVELIVDEAEWEPPHQAPDPETLVYVRVVWGEVAVVRVIKEVGGQWHRGYKLRLLPYGQVERLHILDRLTDPNVG